MEDSEQSSTTAQLPPSKKVRLRLTAQRFAQLIHRPQDSWAKLDHLLEMEGEPTGRWLRLEDALQADDQDEKAAAFRDVAMACWEECRDPSSAARFMLLSVQTRPANASIDKLVEWLTRSGQFERAASEQSVAVESSATSKDAARRLMRMAHLQTLDGAHQDALSNLLEAAAVWPTSPEPLQKAGELACSLDMGREAVDILLEAADRWQQSGSVDQALRTRHQAFTYQPSNSRAYKILAANLQAVGRHDAEDGIAERHANALEGQVGRMVHVQRLETAATRGDDETALAAIVDGRLEACENHDTAQLIDKVLARVGLHELLAARWEVLAYFRTGTERGRLLSETAALHLGRLSDPEQAIEMWIEALEAAPDDDHTLEMLRKQSAALHDLSALAEGLIRGALHSQSPKRKEALLLELAELADRPLANPSLAHWALTQVIEARPSPPSTLQKAAQLLAPRVKLRRSALEDAQRASLSNDHTKRREARKRTASLLAGDPNEVSRYLQVLEALVTENEADRRHWIELTRAASRAGAWDRLERIARQMWTQQNLPTVDVMQYGLVLVRALGKQSKWQEALEVALQLSEKTPGRRFAIALAWVLASKLDDVEARARSIARMAPSLSPRLRVPLFAHAGLLWLERGRDDDAKICCEVAERGDASHPRTVRLVSELTVKHPDRGIGRAFEKFCSLHLPAPKHLKALTTGFALTGDWMMSLLWSKRWCQLSPWDPSAWKALGEAAGKLGQAGALEQALDQMLEGPLSLKKLHSLLPLFLAPLTSLSTEHRRPLLMRLVSEGLIKADSTRPKVQELLQQDDKQAETSVTLAVSLAVTAEPQQRQAEHWARLALWLDPERWPIARAHALVEAAAYKPDQVLELVEKTKDSTADAALDLLQSRALAYRALGNVQEERGAWLELMTRTWTATRARAVAVRWAVKLGDRDRGADDMVEVLGSLGQRFGWQQVAVAMTRVIPILEHSDQRRVYQQIAAALFVRAGDTSQAGILLLDSMQSLPLDTEVLAMLDQIPAEHLPASLLSEAHELAASSAKGIEGQHAAHHRAAVLLSKRGDMNLALRHAMKAIEIKPSDRATFTLLLELGRQTNTSSVIELLFQLGERESEGQIVIDWWEHAARWALEHHSDTMDTFQLGLRAMLSAPTRQTAAILRAMVTRGVTKDPPMASIMDLRLSSALRKLSPKLDGPVGARAALEMVHTSLDLDNAELAILWLSKAVECSPDLEEYGPLVRRVSSITQSITDSVRTLIDQVLALPPTTLSRSTPLLLLCEALASHVGDTHRTQVLRAEVERGAVEQAEQFVDLFAEQQPDTQEPLPSTPPISQVPSTRPQFSKDVRPVTMVEVEQADMTVAKLAVTLRDELAKGRPPDTLSEKFEQLLRLSKDEALQLGKWMISWAQSAMETQHWQEATQRAQFAIPLLDYDGEMVTKAVCLQYRACGTQDREIVEDMLSSLKSVSETIPRQVAPLHAFLVAETMEVFEGPKAAMSYLQEREASLGKSPLLSLAQAERLSLMGQRRAAIEKFRDALRQRGSLHGVRKRSQVAYAAAKTALLGGDEKSAWDFYNTLLMLPETSELASRLHGDLQMYEQRKRTDGSMDGPPEGRPEQIGPAPSQDSSTLPSSPSTLAGGFKKPEQLLRGDTTHSPAGRYSWVTATRRGLESKTPPKTEEQAYERALARGDVRAGDVLASLFSNQNRTKDWLRVRQRQMYLAPWDARIINGLRNAASANAEHTLVDACSHVISVLENRVALTAPPWSTLSFPPSQLVHELLGHSMTGPETEVLSLVWRHASHLFVRPLDDYELSPHDLVRPREDNALSRALMIATSVLSMLHVQLYVQNMDGPPLIRTLLTKPAAALISGNLQNMRESTLLDLVARAVYSCALDNMLVMAMPDNALDQLFDALLAAFGPQEFARKRAASTAMLASEMWRTLPSSAQLRVREILYRTTHLSRQTEKRRARQRTRRGALLVTGNLEQALHGVLEDDDVAPLKGVDEAVRWRKLVEMSPSANDLTRFALSHEYVNIRWKRRDSSPRPFR